jgi:hypothetical protein
MAVATITKPNGHVNGYHGGLGLDGATGPDIEPLSSAPIVEQSPSGSATAVATAIIAPQDRPAMSTAAETKPARNKAVGVKAVTTNNSPAVAKAKSSHTKIRYVRQAQLDAEQARLEKLSRAALAGDTAALDKLRAELDNCPHVWRRLADLQLQVELKLIALVADEDPLRIEAFRKRCSELRHHLLAGEPSSLAAKMAASRAVACWQFVQLLELRLLDSPAEIRCIKALEQAERRYQTAMRTFCLVRQADAQLERLAQQTAGRGG